MARPKKPALALAYSSAWINRNFRIKVYGRTADGNRVNTLVGVAGAIAMLGVETLNDLLHRAASMSGDVYKRKLRRGLQVSFYGK